MTRLIRQLLVAAALGAAVAAPTQSQTTADIALYEGADRASKLAIGAQKEGELTIYTSAQLEDMGALTSAFEKKHGIKANVWRAGSEKVLQRALTEARAGRHVVDVIETNGPELETLHREQLVQRVKSPHIGDLIPAAIRPHGEWVGTRLNVFTQAYNTSLVKKDELPQSFAELAHPRWKGRLGIEAEDADWLSGVLGQLGEERGLQIFRDIVANNGISVRKGHTLLTYLVASGEVPFALTVYNYKAQQFKSRGAPIEWFSIGTAIARPNGIAIPKRAPHPHAAVLFFDFVLSPEGQQILAEREFVPTSKKVDTPLNKLPVTIVDPGVMLDQGEKWTKLYEELFLGTK